MNGNSLGQAAGDPSGRGAGDPLGKAAGELIARAREGDSDAFSELIDPHRNELQAFCYRFLGSHQDAEDTVQETVLSAWLGFAGFEGRASIRTWLYRVATSRCLNALRSASRRPQIAWTPPAVAPPEPTRTAEVPWLEPYPDVLLDHMAGTEWDPEAQYEARETISLAFVTALQLLPPKQRAALILRDVLGFHAGEVAAMVDTTEESVTSALKRARATLRTQLGPAEDHQPPPRPGSRAEQDLVRRFSDAFVAHDVDGIVALLTEDAWVKMPPMPFEYQGREAAARFFSSFSALRHVPSRFVPTRANRMPALAFYRQDPVTEIWHANGLLVLALSGEQIREIIRFEASTLARFGLPRTLA
jgi:RNA polymerase sigma-70 factor (ECF subfamily)